MVPCLRRTSPVLDTGDGVLGSRFHGSDKKTGIFQHSIRFFRSFPRKGVAIFKKAGNNKKCMMKE
jgi:hypothetical protein